MTKREMKAQYFKWMYQLVCDRRYPRGLSYRKLFFRLHEREFIFQIGMDENRAADGRDLRYRFGRERAYDDALIDEYLCDRPCSILEMMLALAIRCEENIMSDPALGDRTGQWFWNMIISLGLNGMDDQRYNERYVDDILDRFLRREYSSRGQGGLFTVRYPHKDLRTVEIWYQMNWYLNEIT